MDKRLAGSLLLIFITIVMISTILVVLIQSFYLQQGSLTQRVVGIILILCVFLAIVIFYRSKRLMEIDIQARIDSLAKECAFQQSILDGVAEPIMVVDTRYQVKMMNLSAREFYSGCTDDPISSFCYRVSHTRETPCDGIEHPCPLEKVRQTGEAVTVIHEHCQANGEHRLVEVIASPLWDARGAFTGIVESMRDVTERKREEQVLQQYTDRLRSLAAQLAEVEDAERQRLSQELHDQVGQNLTALGINLNIVRSQIPEGMVEGVNLRLDDSLALVDQTAEQIRDVMADLRPPVLDDYGLYAALKWYGERFAWRAGIDIVVEGEDPAPRPITRIENALFRIAQEALNNVAKHAKATRVTVRVETDDETLRLLITDDGIGFDPVQLTEADGGRGWGLLTMTERAEAVGGLCTIESSPEKGATIIVEVSL